MSDETSRVTRIFKGAGVIFVGILVSRALGFVGEVLIIRSLSPEAFGVLALAFTIVTILSGVMITGVSQGISRLIASSSKLEREKALIQSGLLIAILLGLLFSVLLVGFRNQVADLMNVPELQSLIPVFALFLILYPVQRILIGTLRGLQRSTDVVLARDVAGKLVMVSILVGFLFWEQPYLATIVYWVGGPAVVLLFTTAFLRNRIPLFETLVRRPRLSETKRLVSFSSPLLISTSFLMMMSNIDILLLGYLSTTTNVGLYRAVHPLKEIALFVLMSFAFLYLPIATETYADGHVDRLAAVYTTSTKWIVWLSFPVVLIMMLYPESVIVTVFSDQQAPAATALVILVFAMFLRVAAGPNGTTVQAIDRPQIDMYAAIVGIIINIGLNLVLIPIAGIEGAAAATLLGFSAYNGLEVAALYYALGTSPFSWNLYFPLGLTALVAVGLTMIVQSPGVFGLLGLCFIYGIVELGLIVVTKSIEETDRDLLEAVADEAGTELRPVIDTINRLID